MNNRFIAGAVGLLLLVSAPAAKAGLVVVSDETVSYSVGTPPGINFSGPPASGSAVQINGTDSYGQYQAYTTYNPSQASPTTISFADDATALGHYSNVQATNQLQVTITNTTGSLIPNVTLTSAITPAGFGFYIADPNTANINSSLLTSNPAATFAGFAPTTSSNPLYGSDLGAAAYSFTISKNPGGAGGGASTVVAQYAGTLALAADGSSFSLTSPINAKDPHGFSQVASTAQQVGYQWDLTNVTQSLGPLAAGASETLTYVSSVSAFTNALPGSGGAQLLAYACFGDPLGKGSGDPDCSSSFDVAQATFDPTTGALSFNAVAVPEPTTWAMLLVGFGLVGTTLRRRAKTQYA